MKIFLEKKLWFHRACRRYFLSKISTLLEAENISDQVFMTSKVPLYWLPALVCMGQKKLRLLWGKNWARRVTFHLWCKSDVKIQKVLAKNVTFFKKIYYKDQIWLLGPDHLQLTLLNWDTKSVLAINNKLKVNWKFQFSI